MKTNPGSQSGAVTPRAFAAFLLCAASAFLAMYSFADTPPAGTLTPDSGPISYASGPFFIANQSPIPEVDSGPECDNPIQPCDDHVLTVALPAGYMTDHPSAAVQVTMSWTDTGSGQSDYDLWIYPNPDPDCDPTDCSSTDGSQTPTHQSTTSHDPEVAIINPLADGSTNYTIKIVPYKPTGESVTVTMELLPGGAANVPFGGADPTTAGVPRYQIFEAPDGTTAQASSGEFNIGFNPHSGRIMVMNSGPIWRLTPNEVSNPAAPECCEALWENKSATATNIGLDPILWTDQLTGRTFASNSTAGANAVYAYSDDDGDNWIQAGFSPPNGGADHETIGSGPYPAAFSALGNPVNQGQAVYYCSQDVVGPASCQRSDDLGASYGPGVFAYDGNGVTQCGGLHGHIHVAPDGTAWLPVMQCGGVQGGALTTDGGTTWTEFLVPNSASQQQGADPSIAIDSDSTIYYSYVNNEPVASGAPPEGHAHVQVGHRNADNTVTWSNDVDLGKTHGIVNAAEIEAVGGSSGRAAVGFLGTNVPGDYQSSEFPGKWYAFISTTYDGGQTWVTVNATPNDPVQSMTGIWQQGGGNQDRNLLDFNEITVDDKGRVLYGYSDGCVTTGCISGTAPNDYTAFMRVARQSGGRPLFESLDTTTEPVAPKPPCLSGVRYSDVSELKWKAPDNGGSDIIKYQVFRGTAADGSDATQIGEVTIPGKTNYDDTTVQANVSDYYYTVKAINAQGTGPDSNRIDLQVTPRVVQTPCTPPFIQVGGPGSDGTVPDETGGELTIEHINIGEPFINCTDKSMMFLMKVQTLDPNGTGSSTLPPNSEWQFIFNSKDTDGNDETIFVELDTFESPAIPRLSIGRRDPTATGTQDTRSCTSDATNSCPQISATYGEDGTILLKLDVSAPIDFAAPAAPATGNEFHWDPSVVGTKLTNIGGNTYVLAGATRGFLETVQTTGGTSIYTTVGNMSCVHQPPVAQLAANPKGGNVPLNVSFDASGSTEPLSCATINSYTLDFGDGSNSVTQSTPQFTHTYNQPGSYWAVLVVGDTAGQVSENLARQVIVANAAPTPTPTPTPTATPTPTVTPTPGPTPTVTLSVEPGSIMEGQSATFTATASSPVSQDIQVNFNMSGKATQGSDYTMSANQITIHAGSASGTVTLTAIADGVKEKSEKATMTLQPGSGYQLGAGKGGKKKGKGPTATVTISD